MEMPGEVADDSPFAGMMHTYFRTRPENSGPPTKPNLAALAGMLGGTIPEETKGGGMDMSAFPRDSDSKTMRDALKDGSITEATITEAARRVLYQIDRFGYLDGKQKHEVTPQDLEGNGAIIEKTAEDAAVLLKNEGSILPLKSSDSIAMIGPTAGQVASIGTFGERSPGIPERQVGPLDALKKLAPDAKVTFAVDDDMTGTPISADLFTHDGKPGLLRTDCFREHDRRCLDRLHQNQRQSAAAKHRRDMEGRSHDSGRRIVLVLPAGTGHAWNVEHRWQRGRPNWRRERHRTRRCPTRLAGQWTTNNRRPGQRAQGSPAQQRCAQDRGRNLS